MALHYLKDFVHEFFPGLASRAHHENYDILDKRTEEDNAFLAQCKEHLTRLETIREEKLKTYLFRKKIAVPAILVLTPLLGYLDYWLIMLQSGSDDGFAGVTFLVLGAIYHWVTSPKRKYAKEYKIRILPKLATLFGNLRYQHKGRVSMDEMEPSKIVPAFDKYESEDHFSGAYKGVNLEFAEINLKQKRRNKRRTYYVSVFRGLAILINTRHKRFYGHTILDENKSKISEWFKEKTSKMQRAEMVDPEFEKLFDAYTTDQVEARYLIDPTMIERLKALYQEYDGEKMAAAFYDNKMLILIASNHNHFEPAHLYIPASDPVSILSMKQEIGQILSIIDRLSLYDPNEVHKNKEPNQNFLDKSQASAL